MSFYCKNCGTELNVDGQKIAVCDFCGMEQTLPTADDPKKLELFVKANENRMVSRFDVAKKQYESIIAQYPDDNEAYWCKLLCEYGIEYVDDDLTEKKLPTCHRTVTESIFNNSEYKLIMSRATAEEKAIYESEAKEIDRIQKEILASAQEQEPYDIFICYKESENDSKKRTVDAQYATKIYTYLTEHGYKVFFSRITLKNKLGSEYEPVIYSALKSAKLMLHVTTSVEHTNAPWVRNEWSRFLEFMNADVTKTILPCIAQMGPYELPDELSKFQVADMTDLDFYENLLLQINKKFGRTQKIQQQATPSVESVTSIRIEQNVTNQPQNAPYAESYSSSDDKEIDRFFKRIPYFIKDDEWDKVDEYAEKILDRDPTNAQAYVCKLQAEYKVRTMPELQNLPDTFEESYNYKKAMSYADAQLKNVLVGYISFIKERNENARIDKLYNQALTGLRNATTEADCQQCIKLFEAVKNYKDSKILITKCKDKIQEIKKDAVYREAQNQMNRNLVIGYKKAIELFKTIRGYRDSEYKISDCERAIREIETRLEYERKTEVYERAITLKKQQRLESYTEAATLFDSISKWKDSAKLAEDCRNEAKKCEIRIENERKDEIYFKAMRKIEVPTVANYEDAIKLLETICGWKDSKTKIESLKKWIKNKERLEEDARKDRIYIEAKAYMPLNNVADFENAIKLFESVRDWRDSARQIENCKASIAKIKQKEEEARVKSENERKICLDLIAQLPEALNRDYLSETRKDVRNRLATLKAKDREIRSDIAKGNEIIAQIKSLEAELKQLEEKRNACMDEKSTLKFFAIKRKAELDHEIVECTKKISELNLKIKELKNKPESAFNSQSMKRILDKNATSIAELDKELSRLENVKTKENIILELENYEYGREYLSSNKPTTSTNTTMSTTHTTPCSTTQTTTSTAKPSSSSVDPSKLQVGDTCKFGSYYQSNDTTKEPIEWLVLAREGSKALLISKYVLDCKPYNTSRTNVTWETCSIRKWLNNDFINTAFTATEKAKIPIVTVSADKNPNYSTNPGNTTQDKVFLLSITEAYKYFSNNIARQCKPTAYAKKNGAYVNKDNGSCWWWLRSPGSTQYDAASVRYDGGVVSGGLSVDCDYSVVRPALWVNLESGTQSPTSTGTTTPNTAPRPTTQTATSTAKPSSSSVDPSKLQVGDIYIFGSYYQSNDTTKEPIEWLVLAREGSKALLISKYALDCKPYNTSRTNVTWEKCSIRKWLNNDFIDTAFTATEKAKIPIVTVSADKNPSYRTNPGKATQDKVFLLSITEANKYFSSSTARQCKPTAYAKKNGAYVNSDNGNWWWLRSPGYIQNTAASVRYYGVVHYDGSLVDCDDFAVRPALWVNL
ncbi:MAG: TIR domain-containing protein [Clostridia bacterium]|nr:TIR domain-containing protein [Clostridia bacterium]